MALMSQNGLYRASAVLGDKFLCRAPGLSSFKPSIPAPHPHGILTRVKLRRLCSGANINILFYSHNLLRLCDSILVGMPADSLPRGQRRFWGCTGCKTEAQRRISHARYNSFDMLCMRNQVRLLYFTSPLQQVSSSP